MGRRALGEAIWKFAVPPPGPTGRAFVQMPEHAQPLSVGLQDDQVVLWALVDPDNATGTRRVIVKNTGERVDLPIGCRFLGTVTMSNGVVWHVWDGDA